MRILACLAAGACIAASLVFAGPPAARANAFCPVTIVAVTNLGILGQADTYGVMLDLDPSDVASVRLRVDSTATRYAVDFNDLAAPGNAPTTARRYFSLPGERIAAAWIESTGTSPDVRLECPITRPFAADAPAPVDPRVAREVAVAQTALRDGFSSRTPVAIGSPFGPAPALACAQPYAPPHPLQDVKAAPPPGAAAVHAHGITIVRVDLDERGTVVRAVVVRSSGFAPLDAAALAAAGRASYQTQTFNCRAVASSYQFTVSFAGS